MLKKTPSPISKHPFTFIPNSLRVTCKGRLTEYLMGNESEENARKRLNFQS